MSMGAARLSSLVVQVPRYGKFLQTREANCRWSLDGYRKSSVEHELKKRGMPERGNQLGDIGWTTERVKLNEFERFQIGKGFEKLKNEIDIFFVVTGL